MTRMALLIAAFVSVSSADVFTCNEIKNNLLNNKNALIFASHACVVISEDAILPDDRYPYLETTFLHDLGLNKRHSLNDIANDTTFCIHGDGPFIVESYDPSLFQCSSEDFEDSYIVMLFTYHDIEITRADTKPKTLSFGKGEHPIVASEGSLRIDEITIADGKETSIQFFTGVGQGEDEGRFPLATEKFVAGTSTVVIGPVTTIMIKDDVIVELTLTSFENDNFYAATPGFEFSLMSSGLANDMQSSFPSILVSTAYGINDDTIAYDSITVTGNVRLDPTMGTTIAIQCYHAESGARDSEILTHTQDVAFYGNCSSLDITYQGNLDPQLIGRSTEMIYLQIESDSIPVLKTTAAPLSTSTTSIKSPPDVVTDAPVTTPTRRTPPPTSTATTQSKAPEETTKTATSTSTTTPISTTSGSSAVAVALIPTLFLCLL